MAKVTIGTQTIGEYRGTPVPALARFFLTQTVTVYENDLTPVLLVTGSYQEFTVSMSGFTVTLDSCSLYSTTDSTDPVVTGWLEIYTADGTLIPALSPAYSGIRISTTSPTTWEALDLASHGPVPVLPASWIDTVQALIDAALAALANASSTVKGITKLDVDPISPTDPIAVGANSPRVPQVLSLDYGNSLSAAIAAIGSTPTVLEITTATTLSTSVTVPATLTLAFQNGAVITKSGSGAIAFQGLGLAAPESQIPCFSGFSSGNITWTGSVYPKQLSANLWADTKVSARIINALAALSGKTATVVAYPGDLSATVTVPDNLSLHLTKGTYTNSITGAANYTFVLGNQVRLYGDGQGQTFLQENADSVRLVYGSSVHIAPFDGINNDILVENITFQGNPSTAIDASGSAVFLGNVQNGTVRYCTFDHTHGFAAYVGGFGNSGNTANGFWITDNIMTGLQTQNVGTVGGKNGWICRNLFLLSQPPTAAFVAVIDIEPNANSDGSENLYITDNIIDGRGARQNWDGIVVQRGYGGYLRNVLVARNRIVGTVPERFTVDASAVNFTNDEITVYGHGFDTGWPIYFINNGSLDCGTIFPDLSSGCQVVYVIKVDSDHFKIALTYANAIANTPVDLHTSMGANVFMVRGSALATLGIALYGADDSVIEDNVIYGTGQNGLDLQGNANIKVRRNLLKVAGQNPSPAIQVISTSLSDFEMNSVIAVPGFPGWNTVITETDGTSTVSTMAGSPIVAVTTDHFLPYNLTGLLITINAVVYTIGYVSGENLILTQNAVSDLSSVTATIHYSTNRYVLNDVGGITLSATGTSQILSDYTRVLSNYVAPTQIAGNQNNYNPGYQAYRLDLSTDASRNLTGLVFTSPAQSNGEKHWIRNVGSNPLVLQHQSGSSIAANRFFCNTGTDITLFANDSAHLEYDTNGFWWVIQDPSFQSTSAELDRFNDVSAYVETIIAAGALSISKVYSDLALVGSGAVTLAAPDGTMLGQIKTIEMGTDNGDVTLSLANVVGGSAATTCTWNDVGDVLVLMASTSKWVVVKEYGVVLT